MPIKKGGGKKIKVKIRMKMNMKRKTVMKMRMTTRHWTKKIWWDRNWI